MNNLTKKDRSRYIFLGLLFSSLGLLFSILSAYGYYTEDCRFGIKEFYCNFFYDHRNFYLTVLWIPISFWTMAFYLMMFFYYSFYEIQQCNLLIHYILIIFSNLIDLIFLGSSIYIYTQIGQFSILVVIFYILSLSLLILVYFYDFIKRAKKWIVELDILLTGIISNYLVRYNFFIYNILGLVLLAIFYSYSSYLSIKTTEKKLNLKIEKILDLSNKEEQEFVSQYMDYSIDNYIKQVHHIERIKLEDFLSLASGLTYGNEKAPIHLVIHYDLRYGNIDFKYFEKLLKYYSPLLKITTFPFYDQNLKHEFLHHINEYSMLAYHYGKYEEFLNITFYEIEKMKKSLGDEFFHKNELIFNKVIDIFQSLDIPIERGDKFNRQIEEYTNQITEQRSVWLNINKEIDRIYSIPSKNNKEIDNLNGIIVLINGLPVRIFYHYEYFKIKTAIELELLSVFKKLLK